MSAAQWFSCRFSKPLITLQTSAAAASLFHAFHALAGLKKKIIKKVSPQLLHSLMDFFSSIHRVQAK